jgi:hypothetical protein
MIVTNEHLVLEWIQNVLLGLQLLAVKTMGLVSMEHAVVYPDTKG